MINLIQNLFRMTLVLIFFVLTACNSETHSETKTTSVNGSAYQNKYPGKPQPPVDLKFKFVSKSLAVGEIIDIELTFKTKTVVDDLLVQFSTDAGLTLMNANIQYSLGPQRKGDKSVLGLKVSPNAEGYFYINVTAILVNGDRQQARSFAIPVNIGNVDASKFMKPAGIVQDDSTGQKIISMPASQPKK